MKANMKTKMAKLSNMNDWLSTSTPLDEVGITGTVLVAIILPQEEQNCASSEFSAEQKGHFDICFRNLTFEAR
jgi:hypothetical protein